MISISQKQPAFSEFLIERGAEVNRLEPCGQTPLQMAAGKGQSRAIVALLGAGVEINSTNEQGRTALDFAATYDQPSVATQLRDAGAPLG